MARKKETPKGLSAWYDFVDSLENVRQQTLLLVQAVDTVLVHDDKLPPGVKERLTERSKALRAASED